MRIVEEAPDSWGRWFVRYADDGSESFSARLFHGTGELGIAWSGDMRQIVDNIAGIQSCIHREITLVTGTASHRVEERIRGGRFRAELYGARLTRLLGGNWEIQVSRRTGVLNEIWDIMAYRIGDQT